MGVIPISDWQLALAAGLILLAGTISVLMKVGLLKNLLWGGLRVFVQLFVMGYALKYIFLWDNPWVNLGLLVFMAGFATWMAFRRVKTAPERHYGLTFLSISSASFLVSAIVCGLLIQGKPFYTARVVIPITGMIIGNSLTAVSLALDRLYGEVRSNAGKIEMLLALGATRWEAARDAVREALRAGMTPIINSMMVVGLVFLPGMMVGQLLAGADPTTAIRYQIVVMLMIAAATALSSLLLVGLTYRRLFTAADALKPVFRESQLSPKNSKQR
ncbi:iron export ABC transporter permease subunit FetB [bacterium]|nr:iron export ABC transporter permease subunit FetB [bacterium]